MIPELYGESRMYLTQVDSDSVDRVLQECWCAHRTASILTYACAYIGLAAGSYHKRTENKKR